MTTPGDLKLTLYIAGGTPASTQAQRTLERMLTTSLTAKVEIVDVTEHPERAEQARILATPTLIKERPPPVRRLIGDLSDHEAVLAHLGLDAIVKEDAP